MVVIGGSLLGSMAAIMLARRGVKNGGLGGRAGRAGSRRWWSAGGHHRGVERLSASRIGLTDWLMKELLPQVPGSTF